MYQFKTRLYHEEKEFYLETDCFDFDYLWKIAEDVVKPDTIGKLQITSWTIARNFEKEDLSYYLEEFYDNTPSTFSIRLLPFGKHIEKNINKLEKTVKAIEKAINHQS